jgi:predicted nicotinamide N-methyase
VLSDLPLAAEISNRNIDRHPQVAFRELDWYEDIPTDISSQHFDAVIVSDCMYNVDAAPALVSVVVKLFKESPETVLVVGHKRRHESEDRFLHLLEQSGMVLTHRTHMDTQEEEGKGCTDDGGGVDLYTMRNAAARE